MAKVSKKPAPGVSEEERKTMLAKLGYGLKKNKRTGDLCAVKKRQTKKAKKQKPNGKRRDVPNGTSPSQRTRRCIIS